MQRGLSMIAELLVIIIITHLTTEHCAAAYNWIGTMCIGIVNGRLGMQFSSAALSYTTYRKKDSLMQNLS